MPSRKIFCKCFLQGLSNNLDDGTQTNERFFIGKRLKSKSETGKTLLLKKNSIEFAVFGSTNLFKQTFNPD